MHPSIPPFIIIMTAIATLGWLLNSWIRTRQPAPSGGRESEDLAASRQIELLSTENAGLKGQVSRLEERIAVLERIATDPAERTAREIDNLR